MDPAGTERYPMISYKLRAECTVDVSRFVEAVHPDTMTMKKHKLLPDCVVEFTSQLSLSEIINLMSEIPDGHVMIETVATAQFYTGERK